MTAKPDLDQPRKKTKTVKVRVLVCCICDAEAGDDPVTVDRCVRCHATQFEPVEVERMVPA